MDTQFGPTLNPGAFEPPFDEIVSDFVEKGRVLHESLADHMRPEWKQRPLEILIVDNASLNASATDHSGCDRIYIFRGALEHIYGTILGLLSTPTFFPTIGAVNNEVRPENLPGGRFPPVPLLKNVSDAGSNTPLFFPNDQTRMTLAQVLAELALEFLVYHEIGHIVGGHFEIPRNGGRIATIAEFQQAAKPDDCTLQHLLECDADAFACHVTSSVHTHDQMAALVRDLLSAELQSKDFALQTYLTSIGVLFRALYPTAPRTLDTYKSSHPHPAVRACLVASSTMARGLYDGSFTTTSLNSIVANSVGNIEDVWADLCLSGQNPETSVVWAQDVRDAAMALFESYGNSRSLFEQYARLPRRWDDWAWPETQKSYSRRLTDSPHRAMTASVEKGMEFQDPSNLTRPATMAAAYGHAHLAMKVPAYINDPDAIVWAVSDGDFDLLVRLVEAGADVNIKSDDGRSALHMAAEDSWSHIAEFLLSRGADPNITDADGDTPHDYAVFHGYSDFAALLVSRGATVREGQSAKQRFQEALDKDRDTVRAFQNLMSHINESKGRNA